MYMPSFLNTNHIWKMKKKYYKTSFIDQMQRYYKVLSSKRNVNIAECSQIKCMVSYADHEVIKEEVEVNIQNFNKYP